MPPEKQEFCKRGHPLKDPNLYYSKKNGKPVRKCKACTARTRKPTNEFRDRVVKETPNTHVSPGKCTCGRDYLTVALGEECVEDPHD